MTEFITRNYGQKEFEVIIKTNSEEHYKAAEAFARKLIDHAKPQTNADRIRAMSDEELAEFITDKEKGWCTDIGRKMYYHHNWGWLKQPAEE